ncbi:polymeric immunoglobulin receptor-like [Siphateles boraxobius]|uniref:polymeric immunoglobulin receptor-like n=1 Tax=Siphateles boraxobius TaxID=180520 RepID=UPI004063733A
MSESEQLDTAVKNAEIKLTGFMAEHNIALRTSANLVEVLKDVFKDSKTAQHMSLGRTKTTAITKHVIGDCFFERKKSTDIENVKMLCVVVSFFDEGTNRIQTRFWKLVQIYSDQQRQFATERATAERLNSEMIKSFTDADVPIKKHSSECTTGSVSREFTVQIGGSVIIPCYYDRKYTEHKKYWCFHAKSAYNYCSILAYANETKGKVSVIDHPDQSFFTVTMRNLQHEDTGSYWCVEEIEGILHLDEAEQLLLTVQSAPDVSVMNSSVSGHEGDNISVQCFYSSGYQNKSKQWCRYKDQSCYTVGRTDTSQNSSVQISDDGRSSFTVLMTGLRLSDSGWYFCSAGDLQTPVQLTVTAVVTTEELDKNGNNNPPSSSEEQQNKY